MKLRHSKAGILAFIISVTTATGTIAIVSCSNGDTESSELNNVQATPPENQGANWNQSPMQPAGGQWPGAAPQPSKQNCVSFLPPINSPQTISIAGIMNTHCRGCHADGQIKAKSGETIFFNSEEDARRWMPFCKQRLDRGVSNAPLTPAEKAAISSYVSSNMPSTPADCRQ